MNLTTLQIDFDPYYLSLNDHRLEYLFGYNVKKCYLEISICFFFLFVEAHSYLLWCNVTTLNFNDLQSSAMFDDSTLSGLFLRTIFNEILGLVDPRRSTTYIICIGIRATDAPA